jgi:alpha-ribazole phosphatase CobZ
MRLNIPIKGIRCEIRWDILTISSRSPLKTLSSATLNGGLQTAKAIINLHVPRSYDHVDPEGLLRRAANRVNLSSEEVVGLMTSASMHNVAVATQRDDSLIVSAIVTAGLSNTGGAGDVIPSRLKKSNTINTILLIDGNPTESCMMDAAKTATEAKSTALMELDVRSSFSREPASGTTTDAIVVASTMRGGMIEYAGTATKLGEMIGTSVKKAVKEAIEKQEGIIPNRPLIQRLRERGIMLEDLINTALELFLPHPGVETKEKASKLLKEGFNQALSDVNIAALVMGGLRLEEDGRHGLIPSLPKKVFEKDPTFLVADEILGMAIAEYIGGSRGVMEYIRFDKAKPGILKKLGPISDDIVAGLVAGVSSNMYTRAMNRR